MEIEVRVYPRATAPHLDSLATAVIPLFPANQGLHLRWNGTHVVIEAANWTGVSDSAVQTQVTNAPAHTTKLEAKSVIDRWPLELLAAFDAVRDAINIERARHGAAAVTRATFLDTIKTKVDSWT